MSVKFFLSHGGRYFSYLLKVLNYVRTPLLNQKILQVYFKMAIWGLFGHDFLNAFVTV